MQAANQQSSTNDKSDFASGANFGEIFYNAFDLFGELDLDGRVISLNGSVFEQTKTNPELLAGQKLSETVFWQASEETPAIVAKAIETAAAGDIARILIDFRVNADKKIVIELTMQPVHISGEPSSIFLSAQQISKLESRIDYYKTDVDELLFAAENADIGLWFWDLTLGNIYSTPKCNELFGVPAYDKLTYDRFMQAVHPDDRERVAGSLRKAHLKGTKYKEEYRVMYDDGRTDWISAEGKSFLDEQGKPQKMTSVVRKITEQKLAKEELSKVYDREKKARDEAVEANRAKDFFLAFVSHELRSPLNAILGWSKILLTKNVDHETRKNALETIERSARSQTKLINDLVDSARVASGKISLEFRPTNLYEIVKVCYHAQKPAADARNLEFQFTSDQDNITVFADANRLQQVFTNLISNAIKFTDESGGVSIEITTGDLSAEVRVSDSGRGIGPESLPNIFRQFSQGDLEKEINRGGLGLGLSIVKILVEKHGGTVVAESGGIGNGATFVVRLPLNVVTAVQPASVSHVTETQGRPLEGLNILIVEDDFDSREVLQLFLEHGGAHVTSCPSVKTALKFLEQSVGSLPDLIISDLAMPDEDGYKFIVKVRALSPTNGGHLPALALSAFATNESRQRALEAGFDRYCTKPFEPERLVSDILELKNGSK